MSVGCIATYSYAGALTLASISWFLFSAPIFKSSMFFLGLLVLPMSLAAQNLFSITGMLLGGVSVLLPVMCSSEYFAVTPWFIGGALCPSSNRIRVDCLFPPSVVQLPFWVLRRPAMWDSWRSLMCRIPRCLSIVCRLVQRFNSMLFLTCHSRWRQKKLVLRQGGGRHQTGSSGRRRRERPGVLKDWNVFSISFKGVFALWAVITEY